MASESTVRIFENELKRQAFYLGEARMRLMRAEIEHTQAADAVVEMSLVYDDLRIDLIQLGGDTSRADAALEERGKLLLLEKQDLADRIGAGVSAL